MRNFFRKILVFIYRKNPVELLLSGYLLIALLGAVMLCLPWLQKISTSFIDNLFIAVSAVSTTGLGTISISDHYTFLGQCIVLLLIQVGGLGYMTFGSFIVLIREKQLSKYQKALIQSEFGLPDHFDFHSFIATAVIFSLTIEVMGSIALYFVFLQHNVEHPLWQAIFHSISAFCTAGFSLFNTSLEQFAKSPLLNITIFILSILGALGFIVITDLWQKISGSSQRITFTSKIILIFTVSVILGGTLLLLISDSFSKHPSLADKGYLSVFQAMTALTTVGFNTFPIHEMTHSSLYLLAILMIIGASPAGTGGGIKSTTIVAVFSQMISTLKGEPKVTCFGNPIPEYRLRLANASFAFYIMILMLGIYVLYMIDNHDMFAVMFEATSALGTVGLSMGITSSLSSAGKSIIILLMLLGRIGPLTIGLALFSKKKSFETLSHEEDLVL